MASEAHYASAEDSALVDGAREGDTAAFEELVARHRDKIYARAFSMVRSEEEAVDLSQEAWIKGWQRLKQFHGDSSFADQYVGLMVRVAGFTQFWAELGKGVQDEIIARTEYEEM